MYGFPGGMGYQPPGLPPMAPFPTPFPQELGMFGPLAYMGLQQSGILPPGMMNFSFSPTTDLWTQYQTIRQFQDRTLAMQQSQRGDVNTLIQYQQSIARASGADWGSLKGRAGNAAEWIGSMLPILSMYMPEAVDSAMGPRGSQTVMASQLSNASRFFFDSSTGRLGATGAETANLTNNFYNKLYGSDAATAQMRGFGAGKAGIMFNELLSRGLVGDNPFASMEALQARDMSAVAGLAGMGGGSGTGLLGGMAGMQTGRLDASKVQAQLNQIKEMTRVVTAIGDLFGANGKPNAPIPELLAALDQMGGGMEYRYNPGQVENTFRRLQQTTATGKISLPEISRMISQNQALLASVGGDPRDAMDLTMRSVNYAAGAANVFSSTPFYGRMDPRTLASAASNLTAQGMNSPAGQLSQLALYLDSSTPGLTGEFKELTEAIKQGKDTYGGGKSVLQALQSNSFRDMYTSGGGSLNNFNAAMMNPEVARSYGNAASGAVRRMQLTEITQMAGGQVGSQITAVLGIDGKVGVNAGRSLIDKVFSRAGAFAGMGDEARAAEIENLTAEVVAAHGGGNINDLRKKLKGQGSGIMSVLAGSTQQFSGVEFNQALQLFSPELFKEQEGRDRSGRMNAGISQALGDLGRYSFTQRLADKLLNMDPKESLESAFVSVLGMVDKNAVSKALAGASATGGSIGTEMRTIMNRMKEGKHTEADITKLRGLFNETRESFNKSGINFDQAIVAGDLATGLIGNAAVAGLTGMSNPLGMVAAMGGGGNSMFTAGGTNPLRSNAANAQMLDIKISGTLTMNKDGTVGLEGSSKSEGPTAGKK